MNLLYDLETDGFLENVTVIHCITVQDLDDPHGVVECYHDDPEITPCDGTIAEGIDLLNRAEMLAGHNIDEYDDQVLVKLAPKYGRKWLRREPGSYRDTLVESRLVYSDRRERDFSLQRSRAKTNHPFPGRYIGAHSLGAWGHRLGEEKIEFSGGFETFTQDMLDYGVQDVKTNVALLETLTGRLPDFEFEGLTTTFVEHFFAHQMCLQQAAGIQLDQDAAHDLALRLVTRREELEALIEVEFPPLVIPFKVNAKTGTTAKRLCKFRGTKEPNKLVHFNPGSRMQLAARLEKKYGWVPAEIRKKTGNPVMEERILLSLAEMYPEVGLVAEYLVVKARLSILQDSPKSYFNLLGTDGRLHGRTIHIGTVTHRVAHSSPNLGNVTSVTKPYGLEMRGIFVAHEDNEQAGWDASGIQLRGLAHYLAKYDGGAYGEAVVSGTEELGTDAHSLHAAAISLAVPCTRSQGKNCTYAFLFGAQDGKLGRMMGGTKALGAKVRAALTKNINGLGPLIASLKLALAKGFIITPDGRRVGIRHAHAALNTLLMAFEATVMKWTIYFFYQELEVRGIIPGIDYIQTGMIHDEVQGSLRPGLREPFQAAVDAAFIRTREALSIRVPIGGTAKFGKSWADTH